MAFLFQDQNQCIRNDAPRAMRLSRPFSFIRTLTVGFGIAPNLLTLPFEEEGARGLGLIHPYRRWGLSPRPENINRPVWRPSSNYGDRSPRQQGLRHREPACVHDARVGFRVSLGPAELTVGAKQIGRATGESCAPDSYSAN